ncbi:MAG: plastocyanin/azurin family copper-binding protein [Candidatus Pacearchaeota archaeon]
MKTWLISLIVVGILGVVLFSIFSFSQDSEEIDNLNVGNEVEDSLEDSDVTLDDVDNTDTVEGIVEKSSEPQTFTIEIMNFDYSNNELAINLGDAVIWTNQDSIGHTVTSDSGGKINSSLLSKGETYSKTFNEVGSFSYHCAPHPYMKGTIVVE